MVYRCTVVWCRFGLLCKLLKSFRWLCSLYFLKWSKRIFHSLCLNIHPVLLSRNSSVCLDSHLYLSSLFINNKISRTSTIKDLLFHFSHEMLPAHTFKDPSPYIQTTTKDYKKDIFCYSDDNYFPFDWTIWLSPSFLKLVCLRIFSSQIIFQQASLCAGRSCSFWILNGWRNRNLFVR